VDSLLVVTGVSETVVELYVCGPVTRQARPMGTSTCYHSVVMHDDTVHLSLSNTFVYVTPCCSENSLCCVAG
jgi:hypothetical protein